MKNYWVFQYTTNVYSDVFQDLDSGKLVKWEVNKHLKKIKKGDEALLYIGGRKGQKVYGIAKIISELYYIEEKGKYYCDIEVMKNLMERELTYKKSEKKFQT